MQTETTDNRPWYKQMGVAMIFQPKTLRAPWYVLEVSKNILGNLEGLRKLGAWAIDNDYNKQAYVAMMDSCIAICREATWSPARMLKSLEEERAIVQRLCPPSIFSMARWFGSTNEYRLKAVDDSIAIVNSLNRKYLVHE